MPQPGLNPKLAALHAAVKDFSGKRGTDAETIGIMAEKFVALVAARWEHICGSAHDEGNDDKISVSIGCKLDLSAKAPVGTMTLSFTPQRVKDETAFAVEDPDQASLPLGEQRRPRRGNATIRE